MTIRPRTILLLATLLVVITAATLPVSAQSITRKDIADILQTCPRAFAPPIDNVDAHRRLVIPYVAMKLNERDGADKWRLLYRMDRQDSDPEPGRLTADVLVWTATREHYDVLSATGAMSPIKHGPITDRDWQLRRPENFPTLCAREPAPPPVDPPPSPPGDVTTRIAGLEQTVRALSESNRILMDAVTELKARVERHLKP